MNRFFLALVLAATSAFAISNSAFAASTPNTDAIAVTADSTPSSSTAVNDLGQTENDWNFGQGSHPKLTELAQFWIPATYCQTFAGPTCPMLVAVPIGAPCTCFGNGVALPGVAH
jgi:hypothetical protein